MAKITERNVYSNAAVEVVAVDGGTLGETLYRVERILRDGSRAFELSTHNETRALERAIEVTATRY